MLHHQLTTRERRLLTAVALVAAGTVLDGVLLLAIGGIVTNAGVSVADVAGGPLAYLTLLNIPLLLLALLMATRRKALDTGAAVIYATLGAVLELLVGYVVLGLPTLIPTVPHLLIAIALGLIAAHLVKRSVVAEPQAAKSKQHDRSAP